MVYLDMLVNYCLKLQGMKKYCEANTKLKACNTQMVELLGEKHPRVISCSKNIGNGFLFEKKTTKALEIY